MGAENNCFVVCGVHRYMGISRFMADHGEDETALLGSGAQFYCCPITKIDREKGPKKPDSKKNLSITSLTSKEIALVMLLILLIIMGVYWMKKVTLKKKNPSMKTLLLRSD